MNFFAFNILSIRRHRHKLTKDFCSTSCHSQFFSQRVVIDWSSLPRIWLFYILLGKGAVLSFLCAILADTFSMTGAIWQITHCVILYTQTMKKGSSHRSAPLQKNSHWIVTFHFVAFGSSGVRTSYAVPQILIACILKLNDNNDYPQLSLQLLLVNFCRKTPSKLYFTYLFIFFI